MLPWPSTVFTTFPDGRLMPALNCCGRPNTLTGAGGRGLRPSALGEAPRRPPGSVASPPQAAAVLLSHRATNSPLFSVCRGRTWGQKPGVSLLVTVTSRPRITAKARLGLRYPRHPEGSSPSPTNRALSRRCSSDVGLRSPLPRLPRGFPQAGSHAGLSFVHPQGRFLWKVLCLPAFADVAPGAEAAGGPQVLLGSTLPPTVAHTPVGNTSSPRSLIPRSLHRHELMDSCILLGVSISCFRIGAQTVPHLAMEGLRE